MQVEDMPPPTRGVSDHREDGGLRIAYPEFR